MNAATRDPARTWHDLQARLAGSFTARTHGLLELEISLLGPGGEFGQVRPHGASDAEVTVGPLKAIIEHTGNFSYRMTANGETSLVAEPTHRSADALEIRMDRRAYEASASFLRNQAEVRSREGKEIARLEGNLTGRRYEVTFDPEAAGSLPVAILLLHHVATNRRRAFRAG